MLVNRSLAAVAIIFGALLTGCSAPDQPTDLRKDGPPNVTTVTVMSDLTGLRLLETATHCRLNDEKRPDLVGLPTFTTTQVCPDDLTLPAEEEGVAEAAPPLWFARVVFDKLLDPTIEDLVPMDPANPSGPQVGSLMNTQPVTLKCNGADVPYNGYYAPNGNRVSYPLGPCLFIQPLSAISVATGADCEVAVKDNVHNKTGESVPTDQRSFKFKLGPMSFRFADPDPTDGESGADDGTFEMDLKGVVTLTFTAAVKLPVDLTQLAVSISEGPNLGTDGTDPDPAVCGTGGTPVLATDIVAGTAGTGATTTALQLTLNVKDPAVAANKWKPSTTYRIEFGSTAKVAATQGSTPGTPAGAVPSDLVFCFHTPPAA
jgi:hypothetical protein